MATKVIYFHAGGREEKAEFSSNDPADDVRDIFRSAAEAGPHDILKLYKLNGALVNISSRLQENTPDTSYRLEVVAAVCSGASVAADLGFDIGAIESRLVALEKRLAMENGEAPDLVCEMKSKVETFKQKLETVEHLSWLGLFKDISSGTSSPFWKKHNSVRKSPEHNKKVYDKFLKMSNIQLTEQVRLYLRKPTFDNWQWEDAEMLILLRQMYLDLNLHTRFNISMDVLHQWLYEIYKHYNNVPFHNFKHCFMVAQMMYGMIWLADLPSMLDDLDILILLTSAICHDLDHPGYNNAYQVNARTELALRYNDISPLENHHSAVAFEILLLPHANIMRNLTPEEFKRARAGIIKCILATDMSKHSEILERFREAIPEFKLSKQGDKQLLLMILIKMADISNEVRPQHVADPWADCLLQEFFRQGDLEKLEGLPVAPFMDREKADKPSSQVGFIKFVLLPLFEALGQLFPVIEDDIIVPVRHALDYYNNALHSIDNSSRN